MESIQNVHDNVMTRYTHEHPDIRSWLASVDMNSHYQLIASSSTSNFSVAFGGITGGNPREPYACKMHVNQSNIRGKENEDRIHNQVWQSGWLSRPRTILIRLIGLIIRLVHTFKSNKTDTHLRPIP